MICFQVSLSVSTCAGTPRCPANQQRLLFDPIREGEKVLHYLAGSNIRPLFGPT
jgi:hypothetical protein